ncbi:MAG: excinuclease ABC subunit UvrA [Candidatus Dadabacteria bacterium]|nr:excinuclease ABC subunit UvrA [Candidatus Dadabacteria bacterium]
MKFISIVGAREHNLKNIDVKIPRRSFTVVTGVSGSGKSSLVFDILFAEAQRRFMESLSSYARQFVEKLDKPDVDFVEGLSPSVSVDQKTFHRNPRSTVGTITEIYDYMRVLFSVVGEPHCYECGEEISSQTPLSMIERILEEAGGEPVSVYSPVVQGRKGIYRKELEDMRREGFVRVRIDGEVRDLEDDIELSRNKKHTIELLVDTVIPRGGNSLNRLTDAVSLALKRSGGILKCEIQDGKTLTFSEQFSCPRCSINYPEVSPRLFSFNSPYGACANCQGLGFETFFDPELIVEDPGKSLREGAIRPFEGSKYIARMLQGLSEHYGFSLDVPFSRLSSAHRQKILYGSGTEIISFPKAGRKRSGINSATFGGIVSMLTEWHSQTHSEELREKLSKYMRTIQCRECDGLRLNRIALSVLFRGKNISDLAAMAVCDLIPYFSSLELSGKEEKIAGEVLKEISSRLRFLANVGLGYISLDRTAPTLSGGEAQRVRLATQMGSKLTGITYVLDEPSIGLHPRDNAKLVETLKSIKNMGNTVVVVEHDEETIRSADFVIDFGPGAGELGGKLVCSGSVRKISRCTSSITGKYLSGKKKISVPHSRRTSGARVEVRGASGNNLKGIDVDFPLGTFICVTGVSGSGKSTLVIDTLYRGLASKLNRSKDRVASHREIIGAENLDRVIKVDQSPIGRTPRSNPATYTGVLTEIRKIFSMLPEAKVKGYGPSRFSFNLPQGNCASCGGSGTVRVEMHFLPDAYVRCDVCGGKRYNEETLAIRYKGKNISDILGMTIKEAGDFFANIPKIFGKLKVLNEVGLGYVRLGQQVTTLSGGEAQRIKLARELGKKASGKTLYILDEPSVGLHFDDIQKLVSVIQRLVDFGNTMVVIEHNLDIIKSADHVIDLGPGGGEDGGRLVACGTPEEVCEESGSHTAFYLKEFLKNGDTGV